MFIEKVIMLIEKVLVFIEVIVFWGDALMGLRGQVVELWIV